MGLTLAQITSVQADAAALPFEKKIFDAVVSTDSYNFWGRDPEVFPVCARPLCCQRGGNGQYYNKLLITCFTICLFALFLTGDCFI